LRERESVEVRDQGLDNLFGYVAMDMSQPVGDREASELLWGSLAEAYAEGGCEIHVHFRAGVVNGGIAGDWCAIFNREIDWLDFVRDRAFVDHEGQMGNAHERCNVGQTVLVLLGKLVELPKGVVGGAPLPSVVRLQPLDDCFRVWVDAPQHAVQFFEVIVGTGTENRERRVALDALGYPPLFVGDGELKGEVVEGRTEVVETVSNDETKLSSGRWLENFGPKELLGAIHLGFGPSSVRAFFEPKSYFGFKALQVIDRPV
jgi:hypothetical protein